MSGLWTPPPKQLYTPPEGHYDLPFTWVFNAANLSASLANPNQFVYLQGGYGDFVLRRVVGISRLLAGSSTYQIKDPNLKPIQSAGIVGASADDIGIVPELIYPELGAIRFDLGVATLPTPTSTAQIAFQGARRMKGAAPVNPSYKAEPWPYTYSPLNGGMPAVLINQLAGNFVQRVWCQINDYDFELYQIMLVADTGSLILGSEGGVVAFINKTVTGVSPRALTLTTSATVGTPSVTVTGNNVVAVVPNTGPGFAGPFAFLNSNPLFSSLIAMIPLTNPVTSSFPTGTGTLPLDNTAPSAGLTSLLLYDSNKVAIANAPVFDPFLDGNPYAPPFTDTGLYYDGAIVPPLWYPRNSSIQLDVYSNLTDLAEGFYLLVYLIGKRYERC